MGRMLKVFLLAILTVMSIHAIRGDVAYPIPHYRAMPKAKWRQVVGVNAEDTDAIRIENTDVTILLVSLMLIGLILIIASIKERKYRVLFLLLPVEILLSGAEVWFCWKNHQKREEDRREQEHNQMNEAGRKAGRHDQEVLPEPSESYEEYLKRVDRLERHICLKCGTQMQNPLDSWHCPKCEPNFFVCEKCGGAKEAWRSLNRARCLRCPKCEGKKCAKCGEYFLPWEDPFYCPQCSDKCVHL